MILDTSAVIAIIQREPGWQQIRSQLEQATGALSTRLCRRRFSRRRVLRGVR